MRRVGSLRLRLRGTFDLLNQMRERKLGDRFRCGFRETGRIFKT